MAANLKIQGINPQFRADKSIMEGLWKADKRTSYRVNVKRFGIKVIPAQDEDSMGVAFKKAGDTCIINMHIPSFTNMQLLVTKDLNIKLMRELKGLNDTYKNLIEHAYKLACGEQVGQYGEKPKGIIKKITDAIF